MAPVSVAKAPTIGCVIRFNKHAATLPLVIESLKRQTIQPDFILGVDNNCQDESADILRAAGAEIVRWTKPYSHAAVLNFGLSHCPTDYVFVLSAHTVLTEDNVIEKLVEALSDPAVACASAKWEVTDHFYTDRIAWNELREKGLRLGSIYSNSMGMLRRSFWLENPFDEAIPTMEDYAWTIGQLQKGRVCRQLDFGFRYLRNGPARAYELTHAIFCIASLYGLRVVWSGPRQTFFDCLSRALKYYQVRSDPRLKEQLIDRLERFRAWLAYSVGYRVPKIQAV